MKITGYDPLKSTPNHNDSILVLFKDDVISGTYSSWDGQVSTDRRGVICLSEVELWAPMPELELPDADNKD